MIVQLPTLAGRAQKSQAAGAKVTREAAAKTTLAIFQEVLPVCKMCLMDGPASVQVTPTPKALVRHS